MSHFPASFAVALAARRLVSTILLLALLLPVALLAVTGLLMLTLVTVLALLVALSLLTLPMALTLLTLLSSLALPTPATVSSLLATLFAGSLLLVLPAGPLALSASAALSATASRASLAVLAIHVFVLAQLARVGSPLRASMVALLLATMATLLLTGRLVVVVVSVAAFARLVGRALLTERATLTLLAVLAMLMLLAASTVLAGFLMLGVAVADVLVLVRLVVLARPLRFGSSGLVSFTRGVSCPLFSVVHLLVLILSVTSTSSPTALSVPCHVESPFE